MTNIKNILKSSFAALFIAVLCVVTAEAVDAKTVSSSNSFISQDAFNYFGNVYLREDYKYSVLTSEYVYGSAYNYTTYYYLCLTNTKPDVTNSTNVTASCDKLVRYTRDRDTNSYSSEILFDNSLVVNNTLYYSLNDKEYHIETYLFIIALLNVISFLFIVFIFIFKG